jgi:signal transduction histidine kinase
MAQPLRLGRSLVLLDLLFGLLEALLVGYPLSESFQLSSTERGLLGRGVLAAVLLGSGVWALALRAWLGPLLLVVRQRKRGQVEDGPHRDGAFACLERLPVRVLLLRVALYAVASATVAEMLALRGQFPLWAVAITVVICTTHVFGVTVFRLAAYERLSDAARHWLDPGRDPLQLFAARYRRRIHLAVLATGTVGVITTALFGWYFLPFNLEHYLRLEGWFPLTLVSLYCAWWLLSRGRERAVQAYLARALSPRPSDHPRRDDPLALEAIEEAQQLPYRLAILRLVFRLIGVALLVAEGVRYFAIDGENAALVAGEAVVVAIGLALVETLLHRATMRPLLGHLAVRHRLSPSSVRTSLSLRNKMLVGFGVLLGCASGLSLVWSYSQYKTLATTYIQRESELRLDSLTEELGRRIRSRSLREPVGNEEIVAALRDAAFSSSSILTGGGMVIYYLPPGEEAQPVGITAPGSGLVAPPLPWAGEALLRRLDRGSIELSQLKLTGTYARLNVDGRDLGAVALCLPGYRGRGPQTGSQVRVLVVFFLVLVGASIGLVVVIATDLAAPIRELERRAGLMAAGDLARPVVAAAGEGDEVGRLSFAFEEMRRALNDKLRSSTEVNLSLEAEVSRRTAELERRNVELNRTLERLQRATDELIRAEKLASMGRLVAGIAHEINNPINAVVNTIGPLEETLGELQVGGGSQEAVDDARQMIRVIGRGAHRTKEIVQALHNYSRGDDERRMPIDLGRLVDETLELLRHQLKGSIAVDKELQGDCIVVGQSSLSQVFMNLVTNAAQALAAQPPRGTPARIRVVIGPASSSGLDAPERVEITVSDNGPGIPRELLPRIFDPFFTTKDVGQGSGLGLSIVHGIIERHGGQIQVRSSTEGTDRGTTFTVTLPRAPVAPA